jgi:hypothetical protein
MRTRGVTTLEWSVGKQFATGALNKAPGYTSFTLDPTCSHRNKKVQVVVVLKF